MTTKTTEENWESRFREKYEGANVWSSKSIDDAIDFIRQELQRHDQDLKEKVEDLKEGVPWSSVHVASYHRAIADVLKLLTSGKDQES